MFRRILLLTVVLTPCSAFAQRTAPVYAGRLKVGATPTETSPTNAVAANTGIEVSKTAFVDGQNVCGTIRVKNVGSRPAVVSGMADSLEVHFPAKMSTPPLPAGSTRGWFKVADVPTPLPGPIAPGKTATIDYCFSLCLAADSPGANSMRNVVSVSVTNQSGSVKTVTTRSISFPPPVLDCQACCLPDGSCTDTLPGKCADVGGAPHGSGTSCASVQCCAPVGTSGCVDSSDCCAGSCHQFAPNNTQCCVELGAPGCSAGEDCCNFFDLATCERRTCCLPLSDGLGARGCNGDADCCAGTCHTFGSDNSGCCFELAASGCSAATDCCNFFDGATCNAGTCCLPLSHGDGAHVCRGDADCCAGSCHTFGADNHGCCFELGAAGCSVDEDCCNFFDGATCNAGKCYVPFSCCTFAGCVDGVDPNLCDGIVGVGTCADLTPCVPFSCCTFSGCVDGVDPALCEGTVGVGTCQELQQFCIPFSCCTLAGCTDGVDPNVCQGIINVGTCAELQHFCFGCCTSTGCTDSVDPSACQGSVVLGTCADAQCGTTGP